MKAEEVTIENILKAYKKIVQQEVTERFVTLEENINLKLKKYIVDVEQFKSLALRCREFIKALELDVSNIKSNLNSNTHEYRLNHLDDDIDKLKNQIKNINIKFAKIQVSESSTASTPNIAFSKDEINALIKYLEKEDRLYDFFTYDALDYVLNHTDKINDNHRYVLKERMQETPKTYKAIGEEINRSPSRVMQRLRKAIRYLQYYCQHSDILLVNDNSLETNQDVNLIPLDHDSLNFNIRTQNCLIAANINTLGELLKCSELDLFKIPNCGRKSLVEIKDVLHRLGYKLNETRP